MGKLLQALKRNFFEMYVAIKEGDAWTRCSLVIMGAGYWGRGQKIKGILMTIIELCFFVFTFSFSLPYIAKLDTLGEVQREEYLDTLTLQKTVNDYDNSLLILLGGIIGILFIAAFIWLYISNLKCVYHLQQMSEKKEHINSFKEDLRALIN